MSLECGYIRFTNAGYPFDEQPPLMCPRFPCLGSRHAQKHVPWADIVKSNPIKNLFIHQMRSLNLLSTLINWRVGFKYMTWVPLDPITHLVYWLSMPHMTIFFLSLTQDNAFNKVPNPYILFERYYPITWWRLIEILYIGRILSPRPWSFSVVMLGG